MTSLERRLKKLEALRTDTSGLAPYSPEWFEYWDEQIYFGVTGREVEPGKLSREELVEVLRYTVQNPVRWAARYRMSND
jgi:hypothetical protein